jgi:hypothetical protein
MIIDPKDGDSWRHFGNCLGGQYKEEYWRLRRNIADTNCKKRSKSLKGRRRWQSML